MGALGAISEFGKMDSDRDERSRQLRPASLRIGREEISAEFSKHRTTAGENVPARATRDPEGDGLLTHSGFSRVPPLANILWPIRNESSVSQRADRDPVSDNIVEAHGVPHESRTMH